MIEREVPSTIQPRSRRVRSRQVAVRLAWTLGFAGVLAFYVWTTRTSGAPFQIHTEQSDYYNLLADAFRHGHLDLLQLPSPELLALPDPYDPVANAGLRLHDASLYDGHYYLYWGPAPALLIFLPLSVLLPGDVSASLVGAVLGFVAFLASFGILRLLAARFAPSAPRWAPPVCAITLATGTAVPFVLRRVAVYEVSILAAYAGVAVGVYLLLLAVGRPPGRRAWLLLGCSVAFSFAVASRVTALVPAVLLVVVARHLWRTGDGDRRTRWTATALLLGPLVVTGVALLAYNWLRFDSPLEFGNHYQLAGINTRTARLSSLEYIPPGLWYYGLARAHVTAGFPFFHLPPPPQSYPLTLPDHWTGLEPVGGLVNVPVVLFLVALVPLFRGPDNRELRRVVLPGLAVGAALIVLISYALLGATMRYIVDFAAFFLVPALLAWLLLLARWSDWRRTTIAVLGLLAIAWGAAFGVAVSMTGYYDGLRRGAPSTYDALQRYTAFVPEAVSLINGRPLLTDVDAPLGVASDSDEGPGFGVLDFDIGVGHVMLSVASDRTRTAQLEVTASPGPDVSDPGTLRLAVDQPGAPVHVQRRADGRPTTVRLRLARGINEVILSAVTPTPPPADDASTVRLITLRDVKLHP